MSGSATIHVIDDDEGVRDGLTAMLRARGFSVRPYDSAQQFLDGLSAAEPGCVITDVLMPGLSGLDLLKQMGDRLAEFPTIMLTGKADVAMAVEALKRGACDFIEKPFDGDVIAAAVTAAGGRIADVGEKAECIRRIAALSPRERQVLDGVVEGRSNKMVASDLGLSPRTVEAYRANLMAKLRASSLSELVRMALLARS